MAFAESRNIVELMRVTILTVMPSPYQRDLFRALSVEQGIELQVYYQQAGASDSPWQKGSFEMWENLLPGWGFEITPRIRFQCNPFPSTLTRTDVHIINCSLTSPSAQWWMRQRLTGRHWIFWGERIRPGSNPLSREIKRWTSHALASATAIAAIGNAAAEDYRRRFPQVRVVNIPYGCDLSGFSPQKNAHAPPVILFCGQMIARKGIDLLLEAFSLLCSREVEAKLLLVGREGELPERLSRLSERAQSRIEWLGFVEPGGLPELFARADIFVLPSRYDGWGVVINQALGAGLPVVCSSAVGAAGELVIDGANGFVVPAGHVPELARALEQLLVDPVRRSEFGDYSARMASIATANSVAKRWLTLLKEVTGESPVCQQ